MKKAALALTAALLLALVAPVFAQPFADVPTDHWAYDAIAELAAKGLVEGYPDGTFKGDRALTRYEMAMIVARLLARIEAVAAQIPGPPPPPPAPPKPEVTKADLAKITALVREFQTDLQALGVRIESIEEELRNLRGQLDKTKITGDVLIRYTSPQGDAASAWYRARLKYTGQVAPNVSATVRMRTYTGTFTTPTTYANVTFDLAYFDLNGLLGFFDLRIGRQYDLLGPIGLLFDAGNTSTGAVDGLKVSTKVAGVGLSGFAYQDTSPTSPPNRVLYGGRAEFSFIPGWTFGLNAYSERSVTAATANAGYGLTVSGKLIEGLSFDGEVISFTPSGGTSRSGYQAGLSFDLNKLTGAETAFAPTFGLSYRNFDFGGSANAPLYGSVYDYNADNKGDFRGWRAELGLTLTPTVSFNTVYESGNVITTGATVANLDVYTTVSLATNTKLKVQYYRATVGGTDTSNFYRLQLTYSW